MKAQILLFLTFFLAANAIYTFTPEWQDCGRGAGWVMDNVTLDHPPVAAHNSTFHLCGKNANYYVINFESVHATSGTVIDQTFLENVGVGYNQYYCFEVNFRLPEGGAKDLVIQFDFEAKIFGHGGCANVTLHI